MKIKNQRKLFNKKKYEGLELMSWKVLERRKRNCHWRRSNGGRVPAPETAVVAAASKTPVYFVTCRSDCTIILSSFNFFFVFKCLLLLMRGGKDLGNKCQANHRSVWKYDQEYIQSYLKSLASIEHSL